MTQEERRQGRGRGAWPRERTRPSAKLRGPGPGWGPTRGGEWAGARGTHRYGCRGGRRPPAPATGGPAGRALAVSLAWCAPSEGMPAAPPPPPPPPPSHGTSRNWPDATRPRPLLRAPSPPHTGAHSAPRGGWAAGRGPLLATTGPGSGQEHGPLRAPQARGSGDPSSPSARTPELPLSLFVLKGKLNRLTKQETWSHTGRQASASASCHRPRAQGHPSRNGPPCLAPSFGAEAPAPAPTLGPACTHLPQWTKGTPRNQSHGRCGETWRGPGHPSPEPGTLRCGGRRAPDSPTLQPGARGEGSSLPPPTVP